MKIWKRLAAFALCMALSVPLSAGAAEPPADVPWEDIVCPGDLPWYYEAVNTLEKAGIVYGVSQGRFAPERPVTREEFVTLLGRLADYMDDDISPQYTSSQEGSYDIGEVSAYAEPYVRWAFQYGILVGDGKELRARQTMTRQEMAAILMRCIGCMERSPGIIPEESRTLDSVCDAGQISSWAKADMELAYRYGLLNGSKRFGGFYDPETGVHACGMVTYLDPRKAVTRAEAAQVIYNYMRSVGLAA